jgi:uridine phosphorylase
VDDHATVPYPNYEGKHEHAALFEPHDFLAYLREQGALHPRSVPESFILLYHQGLFGTIEAAGGLTPVAHQGRRCFALDRARGSVGIVGGFGSGAPAATMVLEELAALGAQRFISLGYAGTLSRDLAIGDIVVCSEAIRDEGVSHHYLPPGRTIAPSTELTSQLEDSLDRNRATFVPGTTWTIDTPYRETIAEIRHYQLEGVLTVEMEAAALFAVGAHRGLEVAAAFVVSDLLAEDAWRPRFHAGDKPLRTLYRAALETLTRRET